MLVELFDKMNGIQHLGVNFSNRAREGAEGNHTGPPDSLSFLSPTPSVEGVADSLS